MKDGDIYQYEEVVAVEKDVPIEMGGKQVMTTKLEGVSKMRMGRYAWTGWISDEVPVPVKSVFIGMSATGELTTREYKDVVECRVSRVEE